LEPGKVKTATYYKGWRFAQSERLICENPMLSEDEYKKETPIEDRELTEGTIGKAIIYHIETLKQELHSTRLKLSEHTEKTNKIIYDLRSELSCCKKQLAEYERAKEARTLKLRDVATITYNAQKY
jgi:hypothetical protein